ncbi:MAG: hypothetical protein HY078_01830 [Elusimicrobia bacterium]|nr:hypothetical protein [Elusimicrobiota bacterium]
MTNLVTLRVGARVHILVPWNDINSRSAQSPIDLVRDSGVQNAPAVFLPVNHG